MHKTGLGLSVLDTQDNIDDIIALRVVLDIDRFEGKVTKSSPSEAQVSATMP